MYSRRIGFHVAVVARVSVALRRSGKGHGQQLLPQLIGACRTTDIRRVLEVLGAKAYEWRARQTVDLIYASQKVPNVKWLRSAPFAAIRTNNIRSCSIIAGMVGN